MRFEMASAADVAVKRDELVRGSLLVTMLSDVV